MAECLCDEGGDGPEAVGEDHRADDRHEDGEDALLVRDGQDVPVAHCAARESRAELTAAKQMPVQSISNVPRSSLLDLVIPFSKVLPRPSPHPLHTAQPQITSATLTYLFYCSIFILLSTLSVLYTIANNKAKVILPYCDHRPVYSNHIAGRDIGADQLRVVGNQPIVPILV